MEQSVANSRLVDVTGFWVGNLKVVVASMFVDLVL